MSRTLTDLPWQNSTRLTSTAEVAALKENLPGDLVPPAGAFELTESVTTGTGVLITTYVRTTS